MARFWASDGAAWRVAVKNLFGHDGTAWRRVRKGWSYDGAAWQLVYFAARLNSLAVSRDACTTTSGHLVTWTAQGELSGWTVTIERNIAGAGWTSTHTGLDPTVGSQAVTYGGSGNSQTEYAFRLSLIQGSRSAFNSPLQRDPPISPC